MKKKILVTGGTGIIGNALIPQLLQNNYEVITLSRRSPGNIIPHWQIDLTQPHELGKVTESIDQVIHLAANVDACNRPNCFVDNVFTTLNIIQWAEKNNVKKIIYTSTSGIYDISKKLFASEISPVKPIKLYGWTKYLSECILLQSSIPSVILRFPHLYGYTDTDKRLITMIIKSVLERKAVTVREESRDYLYIEDAIKAILKAMEYCGKINVFNCGSGRLVSMKDIAKTAMIHSQIEVPIIISGQRKNVALDSRLALKELVWKANISIDQGIKELVNLYRKDSIEYSHKR